MDGMEKSRREKEGRKTRVLLLLESSGKVVSWGRRCGWCVWSRYRPSSALLEEEGLGNYGSDPVGWRNKRKCRVKMWRGSKIFGGGGGQVVDVLVKMASVIYKKSWVAGLGTCIYKSCNSTCSSKT